jgi:hypothetical protein
LLTAGLGAGRVATQLIKGVHSRAAAIVLEAREGEYGTIVLGRKGISRIKEFSMGRVANKVIQLARGHAVWMVSQNIISISFSSSNVGTPWRILPTGFPYKIP